LPLLANTSKTPCLMQRSFLLIACLCAMFAVVIGVFGAHGLKPHLSATQLHTYEIGIRYQFYHAFAIIASMWLADKFSGDLTTYAAGAFTLGIVLFSGSLYLLSTRELIGLSSYKWLGPLTPIGGLCFIVGWLLLCLSIWRNA